MNRQTPTEQKFYADTSKGLRHVFVQNLTLQARVGIHPHERAATQPLTISLDATVAETTDTPETIEEIVCYESLIAQIKKIIDTQHYDLLETLADTIANLLMVDTRIVRMRIRLGKPQAIAEAENVGIEIEKVAH